MLSVPSISIREILDRYRIVLLDAYGVIVEHHGAIPGAAGLIDLLSAGNRDYFIITNDASLLPSALVARYREKGLKIEEDRIISSGMLLADYFRSHALIGARCMVVGTPDSLKMVEQAGGVLQPLHYVQETDVVVLCDNDNKEIKKSLHVILNSIVRTARAGRMPVLLLANPDIIYPCTTDENGLAIGAEAVLLEAALRLLLPEEECKFIPLGKPETGLFKKALALGGAGDAIMVGDQLSTDILGASRAGVDSALAIFSATANTASIATSKFRPTYLLKSLDL